MNREVDVLVRAADAGATYLTWRWLDDVHRPEYAVLTVEATRSALARLDAALAAPTLDREREERTRSAVAEGTFTDVARERELSRALTEAVFPAALRAGIRRRAEAGVRVRVRWTPSPRLARIPWELLCVHDDVRLLEVADSLLEPPSAVHAGRPCLPDPWEVARDRPPLFVIDPKVPRRSAELFALKSALEPPDTRPFATRLDEYVQAGRLGVGEASAGLRPRLTRVGLSKALRTPRSRLFYFGHVSSSDAEPGSAAIHLSDTAETWGMAAPLREIGDDGRARETTQDHRPLAAVDLLLGTSSADAAVWKTYGHDEAKYGYELWPMPPRVAMIACEGGADYRAAETFGLVVAMVNAGAGLVTTTRWTLPTDAAFRAAGHTDIHPTGDLALRVDAAHEGADPLGELAAWQRDRLRRWRATGDPACTPLVWAALTHTIAPARPPVDPAAREFAGTGDGPR
ncbi:CHAT domain-containing protein [Nocardia takedensis]|uniref:CHAT domain-containing protein n=1 Tax=Nocardia takedensis TaxID=259390 RepID=UPI0003098D73|nr:CHAT domain-containing protein [Nocardia takedensis]